MVIQILVCEGILKIAQEYLKLELTVRLVACLFYSADLDKIFTNAKSKNLRYFSCTATITWIKWRTQKIFL